MSSSPNIQLIFYKIQVIGRMDSPYYIFHSFVHNVLGYISLIQHFYKAFWYVSELSIKDIREILDEVSFSWSTI
jgi:hypothetical protein